jgi:hypothetical protein
VELPSGMISTLQLAADKSMTVAKVERAGAGHATDAGARLL